MMPETIKSELLELTTLFQAALANIGLDKKQYEITSNWKDWTLSIAAEPKILNQIGEVLQKAGAQYFQSAPQAKAVLFSEARDVSAASMEEAVASVEPSVGCILQ